MLLGILRTPLTGIALVVPMVLLAAPLAASAQETLTLKRQDSLISSLAAPDGPMPVFIDADKIRGHSERETEAEGNVRLRRHGASVAADEVRYEAPRDELHASGNVRFERAGSIVEGERFRYNLTTDLGFMDKSVFTFLAPPREPAPPELLPPAQMATPRSAPTDSRGNAERLLFQGPQKYRAEQVNYTTCGPGNDDWYIRARELDIDRGRDVGVARGASIVFMDQTILYTPYLSFALHQQRKSGILAPHYGTSNTSGAELTVPYYWNIAPNYDATFFPRTMSKRGLQLGSEFRYLQPSYSGETRIEYLPNDRQAQRDRYAYFLRHTQTFPGGWSGGLNVNRVSDERYFTDLSTLVAFTSQTTLPIDAVISRSGAWGDGSYGFTAFAQRWQTLQTDPLAPITPPYDRMPQLTFTAFRQNVLRTDFDLLTSYVDFKHPTLVSGKRALAYPSFSLPLQNSYAYVIPKIGVHATRYFVDPNAQDLRDQTRVLPIFTADSGVVFERDTVFTGLPFIQTFEPKLYYVYIPFRDQSRLPNFESGLQDIGFATIFSENQFSGHDRINDANQVTIGVISRLIHPDSGIERLRVALAQRYYFDDQKVTLPGVPPRLDTSASSDLLAALSGTILPSWTAEAGWQYNTDSSSTQKFNVATRYQPQPGKVVNLAYRNTINLIKQTDVSVQWPIASQWSAVGRWNWSIRDKRTLEVLAGFEYDAGCWAFRLVGHRFATSLTRLSTSVFMQLELNGVARIGSSPMDVLRRNVGGYTPLNPAGYRADDYYVPER